MVKVKVLSTNTFESITTHNNELGNKVIRDRQQSETLSQEYGYGDERY